MFNYVIMMMPKCLGLEAKVSLSEAKVSVMSHSGDSAKLLHHSILLHAAFFPPHRLFCSNGSAIGNYRAAQSWFEFALLSVRLSDTK